MREDIRIRITPVLREGSFLRSEIPGRHRDVLNSVFGEEKAGKRRRLVSKEKIDGRGHRYKRGNGKNGKSGDTANDGKRRDGKKTTNGKNGQDGRENEAESTFGKKIRLLFEF